MGEYNGSQESDNVVVLKHDLAPFLGKVTSEDDSCVSPTNFTRKLEFR